MATELEVRRAWARRPLWQSTWSRLRVDRVYALAQLERHATVGAWVVDDTGMPKKGRH